MILFSFPWNKKSAGSFRSWFCPHIQRDPRTEVQNHNETTCVDSPCTNTRLTVCINTPQGVWQVGGARGDNRKSSFRFRSDLDKVLQVMGRFVQEATRKTLQLLKPTIWVFFTRNKVHVYQMCTEFRVWRNQDWFCSGPGSWLELNLHQFETDFFIFLIRSGLIFCLWHGQSSVWRETSEARFCSYRVRRKNQEEVQRPRWTARPRRRPASWYECWRRMRRSRRRRCEIAAANPGRRRSWRWASGRRGLLCLKKQQVSFSTSSKTHVTTAETPELLLRSNNLRQVNLAARLFNYVLDLICW